MCPDFGSFQGPQLVYAYGRIALATTVEGLERDTKQAGAPGGVACAATDLAGVAPKRESALRQAGQPVAAAAVLSNLPFTSAPAKASGSVLKACI